MWEGGARRPGQAAKTQEAGIRSWQGGDKKLAGWRRGGRDKERKGEEEEDEICKGSSEGRQG
ncbi:hypothetical protein E2C01_073757 [Portunus trituberculatus]|uniref:Uncharacterized protein n=1 Tax=Portunus trituberculatus TaxID=210409 RepID=A0A5B7I1K4_PORTR|nr:hypothetical protein [Portunus trituberculatus]